LATYHKEAIAKANQSVLEKIVVSAPVSSVRSVAIEFLSDENGCHQSLFTNIALNDVDWIVRREAMERIVDKSVLAEISNNDENLREAAVRRIEYLNRGW